MKNRILLNIGNTHSQFAARGEGNGIRGEAVTFPTRVWDEAPGLPQMIQPYAECEFAVACVVPAVADILRRELPADKLHCITAHDVRGLDFSRVDSTTLGADRLANAVAAVDRYGVPVIVLDCGTAITIETIDCKRRFRGGAIMPGRRMLRRALRRDTAQLPEAPMQRRRPPAIGKTTEQAMLSGIDVGVLGAVGHLVQCIRDELHEAACRTVVTGGDAEFFVEHLPGLQAADKALTLHGIATIMDNRSMED